MTTAFRTADRPAQPPGQRPGAGLARTLRQRGRRRLLREDFLTVLAWASGAAAVALYLADGGAGQFANVTSGITALGIIAGLIGTDLVLVMLLLAARIPFIDSAIGHDRAMEVHGKLGKPALYLILAHMVFLLIGYGLTDRLNPIAEGISMWNNLPDLWLAFISTALFILVVVTSLVAVRKKFPYEFWYVVHLLTYAAVLTALPHQFSEGQLFAPGQWQRWYWIAFYVLVLLAPLPRLGPHRPDFPPPAQRHPSSRGRRRCREHRTHRRPARGTDRVRRTVLHLALPGPGTLVAPPPLQPLRRPGRRPPADHGPQPRQGQRCAHVGPSWDEGRPVRPLRPLRPRGPYPARRGARGLRHRHHAAPGHPRAGRVRARGGHGHPPRLDPRNPVPPRRDRRTLP